MKLDPLKALAYIGHKVGTEEKFIGGVALLNRQYAVTEVDSEPEIDICDKEIIKKLFLVLGESIYNPLAIHHKVKNVKKVISDDPNNKYLLAILTVSSYICTNFQDLLTLEHAVYYFPFQ